MTNADLSPASRLLRISARLLNESFLGFLALVLAAMTLAPMLLTLNPRVDQAFETGQWIIVGLFTLEYALALAAAEDRVAFLRNGWRILDLATIILSLLTLVPGVADALRSTPALRLLRLARVFALGARASGVILREDSARAKLAALPPVQVQHFPAPSEVPPQAASWEALLTWLKHSQPGWYHASNVGPKEARQAAEAMGLSPEFIEAHLNGSSYPHFEKQGQRAVLFLWLPARQASSERQGLLLLATDKSLLTMERHAQEWVPSTAASLPATTMEALPQPIRTVCALLESLLNRQEELAAQFESELRALEEIPVHESRPVFFERTFQLKKALSTQQSDLWRLRGMVNGLALGRSQMPGGNGAEKEIFQRLADQADYLYETATNFRESLLSIIDLHLNVNSFEMNRVMRVLAVASVIGLIPGVVGGLFGMNLDGNPWPLTLPQVAFAVGFGMLVTLYFFFVKGWLR